MKNTTIIAIIAWVSTWATSYFSSGIDFGAWIATNWPAMFVSLLGIFGVTVGTSSTRVTGKNMGADRHEVKEA